MYLQTCTLSYARHLPLSQLFPVYPSVHWQRYVPWKFTQTPPFLQTDRSHSLTSVTTTFLNLQNHHHNAGHNTLPRSHKSPVQPLRHRHAYVSSTSEQLPFPLQGSGSQAVDSTNIQLVSSIYSCAMNRLDNNLNCRFDLSSRLDKYMRICPCHCGTYLH